MIINGKERKTLKSAPAGIVEIIETNRTENLIDSTITMRYTMHPNVAFVCKEWGLTKLNNSTWRAPVPISRIPLLIDQLRAVTPNVIPEGLVGGTERFGESARPDYFSKGKANAWIDHYFDAEANTRPVGEELEANHVSRNIRSYMRSNDRVFASHYHRGHERDHRHGIITYNLTRSTKPGHYSVWVKARTSEDMGEGNILNVKTPARVSGINELAYTFGHKMQSMEAHDVTWYDSTGQLNDLINEMRTKAFLVNMPGKPGIVEVWSGDRSMLANARNRGARKALGIKGRHTAIIQQAGSVPLKTFIQTNVEFNDDVIYHEALNDTINMLLAEPYPLEALDETQRNVVGVHLATKFGFVNAAETGDGKTVTTLAAFDAKSHDDWVGLVICEAVVKTQWRDEAAIWFPQAEVYIIDSRNQLENLQEFMDNRTGPVVLITSYSLAGDAWVDPDKDEPLSEFGQYLMSHKYDDICLDEGLCLRNNGPTNNALKELRQQAEVGVVLTATPYNTSKNDFARLISFARNDYEMFEGVDLDKEYDLNVPEQLETWTKILSPMVQRDSVVDVTQFPSTESEVMYLKPSLEELELSAAITNSLHDILEDLILAAEKVATLNKTDLRYKEAADELKTLRGVALGSVTLARQLASDPECILQSETLGGELVRSTNILDAVTEPTKRTKALEIINKHVDLGDQVIVFTEFRTAGQKLFDVLQDKGYRVGAVFGGGGAARAETIRQFQDGELDVIIATGAAKRGLNLHSGNVLVHYDLSFSPEVLLQRCGRIIRRGSKHKTVKFYYLVLDGTIDLRVMGIVAARTAEAIITSDAVSSTEMNLSRTALSVKSMLEQVDTSRVEISEQGDKTMTLVKTLLGV